MKTSELGTEVDKWVGDHKPSGLMTYVGGQWDYKSGPQLEAWANKHKPADPEIIKDGYWDQIAFVRDTVTILLAKTRDEFTDIQANIKVISEHTSRSLRLPVFLVQLADGTTFIMRNNSFNWKVSVSSPRDVEADFMDLFNLNEHIQSVYCEGFPKDMVYGSYAENKRQFTIELPADNHYLFTFFWIFSSKVLGNRVKGT